MNFFDDFQYPLVVAPMAGGPTTVDLVVASCEAGALGSIAAAYLKPDDIRKFADSVRARTKRPFAINLFIPRGPIEVSTMQIERFVQATATYREELNLSLPDMKSPYEENFERQFAATLDAKPYAISFVFGCLDRRKIARAQKCGIRIIGTATSPTEYRVLVDAGVDAVTLQGIEAGGHRGVFGPETADPEISIWTLLQIDRAPVPLIAAGGLMSKVQVQRALALGANAVQIGTAFLDCTEAGTSLAYRKRLRAGSRKTQTSRVYSGRLGRGIVNQFMIEMDGQPDAILPFPAQNQFTRDLRTMAAAKDLSDYLSLWCGTGDGELWRGSIKELIPRFFA